MKRCLSLLLAYIFLLTTSAWAAEEIRPLGMASANGGTTGDIRVGNTCTTSPLGKDYCGFNTTHILFYADNAVSVNKLYPLAAGDTGFAYVLGGTWSIDNVATHRGRLCTGTQDNTTFLRMDGTCAVPPGSGATTVTTLPWDNITATPTTVAGYGIVDAMTSITDNTVTPAKLNATGGTADNTTWYRGDGYWAAISATPGGSTGQIQYNKGGTFGAVSGAGYDNVAETITLPATKAPSFTATQTTDPGCVKLWEGSAGGVEATGFCAPTTLTDNVFYTLPSADGTSGQLLKTNGSKVLSWVSAGTATAIPSDANPTVDGTTNVAIDTTEAQLLYYSGAVKVFNPIRSDSFVVKSPTTADNTLIMRAPFDLTVTRFDCIVAAATSIAVTLQECNSSGASCVDAHTAVTCTTTGANTTSFSNMPVASGNWIKAVFGTPSGTPGFVTGTFQYTVDRK